MSIGAGRFAGLATQRRFFMKTFSCGDVVPGCNAKMSASDEAALMQQVQKHAKDAHGMNQVSPDLAAKVKSKMKES
jgi:predicted small metal-binding protein